MIKYTSKDYSLMVSKRLRAFAAIADELGKEHPLTKMMGSLAWGRTPGLMEHGTDASLRALVEEKGFLDGIFHIMVTSWCNLYVQPKDQRVLLKHYPEGHEADKRP